MDEEITQYSCIECGKEANELYKDFGSGILKISRCKYCDQVVDKYIEFDPVIIFLDAVLHKTQAYRHILFNTQIKSPWRFAIIFLFCDAYTKWVNLPNHPRRGIGESDYVFYAALEFTFYVMFLVATCEFIAFTLSLSSSLWIMAKITGKPFRRDNFINKGVLLSNMGKILVVPAIIWGQSNSIIYLTLTRVFIFTSNTQALRVLCDISIFQALLVATVLNVSQIVTACISQPWIMNLFSS